MSSSDIAVLLELSLAIGDSLDLQENCDRFLTTLMARKNFAWAGVWLFDEVLPDQGFRYGDSGGDEAVLVYGRPSIHVCERSMARSHSVVARLRARGAYSVAHEDPEFAAMVTESNVRKGAYAVFPLADIGLLKLLSVRHEQAFSLRELRQLETVTRKFAVSLKGCIAHSELRQSEERCRRLVEHAPEGVMVFDADSHELVDCNSNATAIFRTDRATLLTASLVEVSPERQPSGEPSQQLLIQRVARALGTDPVSFEWTLRAFDNTAFPAEMWLMRLPHARRRLIRCSMIDISGRRRLEQQLRQAQKMEAVGQLAGGVAHDFNNALAAILNYGQLIRDGRYQARHEEFANEIAITAERAAELVHQLLTFSRHTPADLVPIDVHECIDSGISLLVRTLGQQISIKREYRAGHSYVLGAPSLLEQVIVNLAVNARDAMPEGGSLTFATRCTELQESDHGDLCAGRYLLIEVSDTGIGMDNATLRRVFEPFFTTKDGDSRTGLGLAVSYGTIKAHGGAVEVASVSGSGTTFKVYLPLFDDSQVATAPEATQPKQPARRCGKRRILLAEDEPAVRASMRHLLEDLGYDVATVDNGEDLVNHYKQVHPSADLLIVDVMIPGLSSPATLRHLKGGDGRLPALLISGSLDQHALAEMGVANADGFLMKPFRVDELAAEVSRLLDRQPAIQQA